MLKEHSQPISIDEQIDNLRSLGLVINNEEYAKQILNDVSYFRMIKAYSLGLKERNGNYHTGITFERIVDLYKFNCKFRQMLFVIVERIEVNLRCRISNYFSEKYGAMGYEDSSNFQKADYHSKFLAEISEEIGRNSGSPFVKNFRNNYVDSKIPFYALVELFSFGTLSKFYKNMKNEDKKAIALTYGVGYTYFESWIESVSYVRNICAHYGRLYNAKLAKKPMLYNRQDVGVDPNRVFAVIMCMSRLIPHDGHYKLFVEQVDRLFRKYPDVNIHTMGFVRDWKERLFGK